MLLRHPVNQITVGYCHFVIPDFELR